MQRDIADVFIDILGDDGLVLVRDDIRISPAYLMRLHVIVVEIPRAAGAPGVNRRVGKRRLQTVSAGQADSEIIVSQ